MFILTALFPPVRVEESSNVILSVHTHTWWMRTKVPAGAHTDPAINGQQIQRTGRQSGFYCGKSWPRGKPAEAAIMEELEETAKVDFYSATA